MAVWLSAVLWIEHSTRAQVTRVLDARLIEAARMVSSLVSKNQISLNTHDPAQISLPADAQYQHQQFCQIWSFSGELVGRSQGAPAERLLPAEDTGFRNITQNGERLRVFAIVNRDLGGQVMVGDSLAMRDKLVHDVVAGFLWPALVILPVMAALIWFATARGLAPLDQLARQLEGRKVSDLGALPEGPSPPREIRPVTRALNDLLHRLAIARSRERDFISYAAHELKTPLAGLKMQAHVARRAEDDATRDHALAAIERSVTRTDRMVRQLLDLARVEQRKGETAGTDPGAVARQTLADLTDLADRRGVALRLDLPEERHEIASDEFLLTLALRNLIENAIQATPSGGEVRLALSLDGSRCTFDLRDGGTGLPEAIRARATEKFVKGTQFDDSGSGLGLAIATDALETLGGELRFEMLPDGHHTRIALPV